MPDNPYSKFDKDKLILRDYLATDRTILANERTLLAYIRAALTLVGIGVSFIQFFDSLAIHIVGGIMIPAGIMTFVIGFIRYRKMNKLIQSVKEGNQKE